MSNLSSSHHQSSPTTLAAAPATCPSPSSSNRFLTANQPFLQPLTPNHLVPHALTSSIQSALTQLSPQLEPQHSPRAGGGGGESCDREAAERSCWRRSGARRGGRGSVERVKCGSGGEVDVDRMGGEELGGVSVGWSMRGNEGRKEGQMPHGPSPGRTETASEPSSPSKIELKSVCPASTLLPFANLPSPITQSWQQQRGATRP